MKEEKTIDSICIYHPNQECAKAKLITNTNGTCNGYDTKKFCYTPDKKIEVSKEQAGDYQI